jgi:hypothetical protein
VSLGFAPALPESGSVLAGFGGITVGAGYGLAGSGSRFWVDASRIGWVLGLLLGLAGPGGSGMSWVVWVGFTVGHCWAAEFRMLEWCGVTATDLHRAAEVGITNLLLS